jgi:hypothetical protein
VLRLMRENGLLSPHRPLPHRDVAHDGRITTAAPNSRGFQWDDRQASSFEHGLSDAEGVCGTAGEPSVPRCNGPGRCGVGAFASRPVAPIASQEATTASGGAGLKLTVIRKIGADQPIGFVEK